MTNCASASLIEEPPIHPSLSPKLSILGLSLTLGGRVVLDEVGFDVAPGEIVGLLGPNGSGKTSLMRCLTGLIRPERGALSFGGEFLGAKHRALREQMGVVFQDASLDNHLRAIENLELGGRLFGLSRKEAHRRALELLEFMELQDRAEDLTKTFSGGMRRRLELARALIHAPGILLLDEPTTGLDPIAFELFWQRLLSLRAARGLTVLVSTHRADEAERCDRLIVMDRGHLIAAESPKALMAQVSGEIISLVVSDPASVKERIETEFKVKTLIKGPKLIEIELEEAHLFIPRLVEAFPVGSFESLSMRRPTLADAFFHLTGHTLDGEPGGSR